MNPVKALAKKTGFNREQMAARFAHPTPGAASSCWMPQPKPAKTTRKKK